MKPLVLIDFDHTLSNTQRLKHEYPHIDDAIAYVKDLPDNSFSLYLYPDATPFIKFTTQKFQPAIFTEGPVDFQQDKISKSGIGALIPPQFHFIYPPHHKNVQLKTILSDYQTLALVDDKPDMIENALTLKLPAIRVNRGQYHNIPTTSEPTFTVDTLQEIINQDLLSKLHHQSLPAAQPS